MSAGLVIISRKEAKAQGLNRYFTGKPCRNGHVAERSVKTSICRGCSRASYQRNKEEDKQRSRKWRTENQERKRLIDKKWREDNKEHKRATDRKYYHANSKAINTRQKEQARKWRESHRDFISKRDKENRALLRDVYIGTTLRREFGLTNDQITPGLIEMKRNQIKAHRLLKEAKRGINQ